MNPELCMGYGTIRPKPTSEFDPNWGHNMMKEERGGLTFKQYCRLDPFTDEGKLSIAKYNNFDKEWTKAVNDPKRVHHTYSEMSKRWLLLKLYATYRPRRVLHLDPIEGGHRRLAAIQTFLCAPVAGEDGMITEHAKDPNIHNMFRPKDFEDVNIINQDKGRCEKNKDIQRMTAKIIGTSLDITHEDINSEFYKVPSYVTVCYLFKKDITVPKFLTACRTVSLGLANQKRESATKDPITEVGSEICSVLKLMTDNSLQNRPQLWDHCWPNKGSFPGMVKAVDLDRAIKKYEEEHSGDYKIEKVLPNAEFLHDKCLENYCKDPMNKSNFDRFRSFMGTNTSIDGKTLSMQPPYIVPYESMSLDFNDGPSQHITAEMANKYLLVPIIIHILYSHLHGMTLKKCAKDTKCQNIVLYTMRHHIHQAGILTIKVHPAAVRVYEIGARHHTIASPEHNIIGTALYFAEFVNTCLRDVADVDTGKCDPGRKEKLDSVVNYLSSWFSTFSHFAGNPTLQEMLNAIGNRTPFQHMLTFIASRS